MKNVSTEFKKTMEDRTNFYYSAHITFANGEEIDLSPDDVVITGNSITQSAGTSAFPLGSAIGKSISFGIRNNEDQYSEYDFYNAVIQVFLHFDLSETTESINLGKYTVRDPETYGSTITITAIDDMYKADTDYTGSSFPSTVLDALLECCDACGLTLLNSDFANNDFIIQNAPTGITNRQFIGLCAMIAGGNALVDEYGRLKIVTYDFSYFESNGNYDGGSFDTDTPYSSGDEVDGGEFSPWDTGTVIDGGTFTDQNKYHVFYKNQNPTIATDDVIITGIQIAAADGTAYIFGDTGYVLDLENQLATGNEENFVNRIGKYIVGLKFRPFSVDHVCYPLAEFGDLCYVVDRKNRVYQSVITDVDFSLRGFTVIKCTAESPQRNSSKFQSNAEIKAVIKARQETEKQITQYDKSVQLLTTIIANSMGMFTTTEKTTSGGVIIYQHNKPDLSESDIIWMKTESAFSVSTDGGETWNAGLDADGNAVVNVLSAIGINFDWARGGTITLGGVLNGNGKLIILDSSGNQVGYIDNTGVNFKTGTFTGEINSSVINGSNIYSGFFSTTQKGTSDESGYVQLQGSNIKIGYSQGFNSTKYWKYVDNLDEGLLADTEYEAIQLLLKKVFFLTMNGADWACVNNVTTSYENEQYYNSAGNPLHNGINFFADVIANNLYARGDKNRLVSTETYGDRLLYSYETPTPYFGDIGTGQLNDDGECIISIDPIFLETISQSVEYVVFLQKEGNGDIWVEQKEYDYFVAKGTPNLSFSWEIKAAQKGYETKRLDDFALKIRSPEENVSAILNQVFEENEEEKENLFDGSY